LSELRQRSGRGVDTLARELMISRAQLYAILKGKIRKPPDWTKVVEPLVRNCGGDKQVIADWRQRHAVLIRVHDELNRRDRLSYRSARTRTPLVRPAQLPSDFTSFTARKHELSLLDSLLPSVGSVRTERKASKRIAISVITGTAGVGKTALAVRWAHSVRDRFPDGQLYVNLRGFDISQQAMEPVEALRQLLEALGAPPRLAPSSLDVEAARYRSLLDGRRMVIILDNARSTAQVRPLLPAAPDCFLLVTSRHQLTSLIATGSAQHIFLDLLTSEDSRQLLRERLGNGRLLDDPEAVEEIIAHCSKLPLALALVAARAAVRPHIGLNVLADELRNTQQRWETLTGDDPAMDTRTVFSWSYNALTPAAARLFRLMGLHPGPDISAPAAASLGGLSASEVRHRLLELTQASLLAEHRPHRYASHDLLHDYAAELAHTSLSDDERDAALLRMLDFYLHTAYNAAQLLDANTRSVRIVPHQGNCQPQGFPDVSAALAWLEREHTCLLALQHIAAIRDRRQAVWQLAWVMTPFHLRRGRFQDALTVWKAALLAVENRNEPDTLALVYRSLGIAYGDLQQPDHAIKCVELALALAEQRQDGAAQAEAHWLLGWTWDQKRENQRALDHYTQSLHLYRTVDDPKGEAKVLNGLGWYTAARAGDYDRARAYCASALVLARRHGYASEEGNTLATLGYIEQSANHLYDAVDHYKRAVSLRRRLGFKYRVAHTLEALGESHVSLGQGNEALAAWEEALNLYRELQHRGEADRIQRKLDDLFPPVQNT
jgi:tetratricopeptide (TPR) repeat protein